MEIEDEGFIDIRSTKDVELVAHIISDLDYQIKGKAQKYLDRIIQLKAKP